MPTSLAELYRHATDHYNGPCLSGDTRACSRAAALFELGRRYATTHDGPASMFERGHNWAKHGHTLHVANRTVRATCVLSVTEHNRGRLVHSLALLGRCLAAARVLHVQGAAPDELLISRAAVLLQSTVLPRHEGACAAMLRRSDHRSIVACGWLLRTTFELCRLHGAQLRVRLFAQPVGEHELQGAFESVRALGAVVQRVCPGATTEAITEATSIPSAALHVSRAHILMIVAESGPWVTTVDTPAALVALSRRWLAPGGALLCVGSCATAAAAAGGCHGLHVAAEQASKAADETDETPDGHKEQASKADVGTAAEAVTARAVTPQAEEGSAEYEATRWQGLLGLGCIDLRRPEREGPTANADTAKGYSQATARKPPPPLMNTAANEYSQATARKPPPPLMVPSPSAPPLAFLIVEPIGAEAAALVWALEQPPPPPPPPPPPQPQPPSPPQPPQQQHEQQERQQQEQQEERQQQKQGAPRQPGTCAPGGEAYPGVALEPWAARTFVIASPKRSPRWEMSSLRTTEAVGARARAEAATEDFVTADAVRSEAAVTMVPAVLAAELPPAFLNWAFHTMVDDALARPSTDHEYGAHSAGVMIGHLAAWEAGALALDSALEAAGARAKETDSAVTKPSRKETVSDDVHIHKESDSDDVAGTRGATVSATVAVLGEMTIAPVTPTGRRHEPSTQHAMADKDAELEAALREAAHDWMDWRIWRARDRKRPPPRRAPKPLERESAAREPVPSTELSPPSAAERLRPRPEYIVVMEDDASRTPAYGRDPLGRVERFSLEALVEELEDVDGAWDLIVLHELPPQRMIDLIDLAHAPELTSAELRRPAALATPRLLRVPPTHKAVAWVLSGRFVRRLLAAQAQRPFLGPVDVWAWRVRQPGGGPVRAYAPLLPWIEEEPSCASHHAGYHHDAQQDVAATPQQQQQQQQQHSCPASLPRLVQEWCGRVLTAI